MQHRLATAATRLRRRSRDWPLVGQFAFAFLVIIIVVTLTAVISNALRGDRADRTGAAGRVTSLSSTSSSVRATLSSSTTSTSTLPATPTTRAPRKSPRLVTLTIAPETHETSYDRDADFGGWIGEHGCQDTRAVLLIRASRVPVTVHELEPMHCEERPLVRSVVRCRRDRRARLPRRSHGAALQRVGVGCVVVEPSATRGVRERPSRHGSPGRDRWVGERVEVR